jgi:SAM-dependent methyltransferase
VINFDKEILSVISKYYSNKIEIHGDTPLGVDWNDDGSQYTRFEQLLKLVDYETAFTINDYGCGYGELANILKSKNIKFKYFGNDISPEMIQTAIKVNGSDERCTFALSDQIEHESDYVVANGVFNVKLEFSRDDWTKYVIERLNHIYSKSKKGIAVNFLTTYTDVDPNKLNPKLYYADPNFMFDYCKRHLSKNVSLLHDYRLFEFTIIVRKIDQ